VYVGREKTKLTEGGGGGKINGCRFVFRVSDDLKAPEKSEKKKRRGLGDTMGKEGGGKNINTLQLLWVFVF